MSQTTKFVTLGTAGGPTPKPERAPPAHLILHAGRIVLVDCGEGTFQQIHKAGYDLRDVNEIFLSHHHFDHIGSLFAGLGMNMMLHRRSPLAIYGPPGTQQIVDGLLSACDVPHHTGFGISGQNLMHPRDFVHVHEVTPTDTITLGTLVVSFCENTHYRGEDKHGTPGPVSLALRFDAPDRSLVFTGDTGPCTALESFAKDTDLLVGEMIDVERTMARVRRTNQTMPEDRLALIDQHMREHHLQPEQLGQLAARAAAAHVVAVHLPFDHLKVAEKTAYCARIASQFSGKVSISEDLAHY